MIAKFLTTWVRLTLFLSVIPFLLSCNFRGVSDTQAPRISSPMETITVGPSQEKTSSPLINTLPFAPTLESIQTPVPKSTYTRTPAPSPTITWTPLPTLTRLESLALIQELYETNAGCRFPCWWGIIPEKTDWWTTKQFLSRFSTVREWGKDYIYKDGSIQLFKISASYEYNFGDVKGGASFTIEDGIITSISVYSSKGSYPIDRLLREYGQPLEAYITAFQDAPNGHPPLYLILNYPDLDTVAVYETEANKISNSKLRGCFEDSGPRLKFLSKLKTMTFKEMADLLFGSYPPVYPKRIGEATTMDEGNFYQYVLSVNQLCIDTPSDLWP